MILIWIKKGDAVGLLNFGSLVNLPDFELFAFQLLQTDNSKESVGEISQIYEVP